MSLRAFDRIWSPIFVILGIAALGIVLINLAGLSPSVAITCALGGLLTIAFGLLCFSMR